MLFPLTLAEGEVLLAPSLFAKRKGRVGEG
jgi:hypothetical protein